MSAPDRPTREQVDAALRRAEEFGGGTPPLTSDVLAAEVRALTDAATEREVALAAESRELHAEVRALRAELDEQNNELDAADAVAEQLTRAFTAVLARCNDEIENRPGCSCAGPPDFGDGLYGSHESDCESQEPPMLHAAEVRDQLTGVAPLPAVPDGRPEVVTICGSMRFFPQILEVAATETAAGQIVLAPFSVAAPEDQGGEFKAMLDELHRRKIDMADRVVVVTNQDGYVGTSTRAEIAYAAQRGMTWDVREFRLPAVPDGEDETPQWAAWLSQSSVENLPIPDGYRWAEATTDARRQHLVPVPADAEKRSQEWTEPLCGGKRDLFVEAWRLPTCRTCEKRGRALPALSSPLRGGETA